MTEHGENASTSEHEGDFNQSEDLPEDGPVAGINVFYDIANTTTSLEMSVIRMPGGRLEHSPRGFKISISEHLSAGLNAVVATHSTPRSSRERIYGKFTSTKVHHNKYFAMNERYPVQCYAGPHIFMEKKMWAAADCKRWVDSSADDQYLNSTISQLSYSHEHEVFPLYIAIEIGHKTRRFVSIHCNTVLSDAPPGACAIVVDGDCYVCSVDDFLIHAETKSLSSIKLTQLYTSVDTADEKTANWLQTIKVVPKNGDIWLGLLLAILDISRVLSAEWMSPWEAATGHCYLPILKSRRSPDIRRYACTVRPILPPVIPNDDYELKTGAWETDEIANLSKINRRLRTAYPWWLIAEELFPGRRVYEVKEKYNAVGGESIRDKAESQFAVEQYEFFFDQTARNILKESKTAKMPLKVIWKTHFPDRSFRSVYREGGPNPSHRIKDKVKDKRINWTKDQMQTIVDVWESNQDLGQTKIIEAIADQGLLPGVSSGALYAMLTKMLSVGSLTARKPSVPTTETGDGAGENVGTKKLRTATEEDYNIIWKTYDKWAGQKSVNAIADELRLSGKVGCTAETIRNMINADRRQKTTNAAKLKGKPTPFFTQDDLDKIWEEYDRTEEPRKARDVAKALVAQGTYSAGRLDGIIKVIEKKDRKISQKVLAALENAKARAAGTWKRKSRAKPKDAQPRVDTSEPGRPTAPVRRSTRQRPASGQEASSSNDWEDVDGAEDDNDDVENTERGENGEAQE